MPYPFFKIEADTIGKISKWDMPVNEWMGLKFGVGASDSLFAAAWRFGEEKAWENNYQGANLMKPEVANAQFGIPGYLQFDEPIDIQRARLMNERKLAEMKNAALLDAASHSWFSGKAFAGFGAMIAGNLANPVDLGLAFLPIVGTEKAAAGVAKLGGGAFRQSFVKGLVTEEALIARKIPFPRLTGAMIDGVINQTIAEIPTAIQKHRDQANYTTLDSTFNILAAAPFAAAAKALGIALEDAAAKWKALDPRIKQAEIVETLTQMVNGERPKGGNYVSIDEAIIKERALARLGEMPTRQRMRAEAVRAFESTLEKQVDLPEAKVNDIVEIDGNKFVVTAKEADSTVATVKRVDSEMIQSLGKLPDDLERVAIREAAGETLTPSEIKVLRDAGPEKAKAYVERVNELAQSKTIDDAIAQERSIAIKEFIEAKKKEYEAKLKGVMDEETAAEVQAQLSKGKSLPDDQIKKFTFNQGDTKAMTQAVEEDIAAIEAELKATGLSDEEMAALKEETKALGNDMPAMAGGETPNVTRVSKEFFQEFTDADGVVNVSKLLELISTGKIEARTPHLALAKYLLETAKSKTHELESIFIDTNSKSSKDAGFQGRFTTKGLTEKGVIKLVAKNSKGEWLPQRTFVRLLNHELVHNAVTSKLNNAPTELSKRARQFFDSMKLAAKGTEWEKHNAFKNVEEFFSEALSFKKFQEWLMSIDYTAHIPKHEISGSPIIGTKNWLNNAFGNFLGLIKEVLGIPNKLKDVSGKEIASSIDAISALDEAVNLSKQLESVSRNDGGIKGVTSYMRATSQLEAFDEMKAINDEVFSAEKAIDKGIPCVINKASK